MQGRAANIGWMLAFEFAPAAIFGSAAAFAAAAALALPQFDPTPLGVGFGAFCGAWMTLRLVRDVAASHSLPRFEPGELGSEPASVSDLLNQADVAALVERLSAPGPVQAAEPADELILEDVLEAVEPGSRVVRLFERGKTPGELHARIERHLQDAPGLSGAPDATQELHDAIAALRRSLR